MTFIPGTTIPQPGVPMDSPSGTIPVGISGGAEIPKTPEDTAKLTQQYVEQFKKMAEILAASPASTVQAQEQVASTTPPPPTDLLTDIVTGKQYSRMSPTEQYKPYTPVASPAPAPAPTSAPVATPPLQAKDVLNNLITTLNSTLGQQGLEVGNAEKSITSFYSTYKTGEDILAEEFKKRGIAEKSILLNELDARIKEQSKTLEKLPEAIRSSLQDVGVTESQLIRLQTKEAIEPTKILKDLLIERKATADELTTAMNFAEQFANTRLKDEATKLSALEFLLKRKDDQFKDIQTNQKDLLTKAISEQKDRYMLGKELAQNGAPDNIINDVIYNSKDMLDALTRTEGFLEAKTKTVNEILAKKLGVSSSEIAKGLSASGKTIDAFSALSSINQLDYIYGAKKDLAGGRLIPKDLEGLKTNLQGAIEAGKTRQELETKLNELKLPPADELELLLMLDQIAPQKVGFITGLKSIFGF